MCDLRGRTRNRSRIVPAILCASAMILAIACENGGVANPAAPSDASSSSTAGTSASASFDTLARDGGRVLVPIMDTGTTGWSGTCTVQRSGTRGSFKATGIGATPNMDVMVRLVVQRKGSQYIFASGASTNDRNVFRSPRRTLTMLAADVLRCELRSGLTVLAASAPFSIPL